MNMINNLTITNELHHDKTSFYKYFLEDDFVAISKQLMQQKKWMAMPVRDGLEIIESEWLSDAIHRLGSDTFLEYSFCLDGEVIRQEIGNNQRNILNSDDSNSDKFLLITNGNIDFLYYRNQNNAYHIFAGSADFVAACVHCSVNTAKEIFLNGAPFGFYGEYEKDSEEHKQYIGLWFLYQENETNV